MRLLYTLALTALAAALLYGLHIQLGLPMDPRAGGCDPSDVAGSQTIELVRFSQWLLTREGLGLILMALATFAILYFQAFHSWQVALAWFARSVILVAIGITAALVIQHNAEAWVALNSGSCLVEATQTNSTGLGYAGRFLPVRWPWAIFADAVAFSAAGSVVGWTLYLIARRARA